MRLVMKLVGLVNGDETSFDGKYVVDYDPMAWTFREITSQAELEQFLGTFVTVTDDPAKAKQFASLAEAVAFWKQDGRGVRPWDGRPNRPLTAFSVETSPVPEPSDPDVPVA